MILNEMRRPHDINELIMYLVQANSFHEVKHLSYFKYFIIS